MNFDALLAALKRDEGWSPVAYQDSHPEKYWTIGYGFLIDARKGVGLPEQVAEHWLRYAVTERLNELKKGWPAFEKQPEEIQQALANMAYQLGPAGVLKFQKMLAALEAGDRNKAAEEALDSTWQKQTPQRARRIAAMIRGLPT